MPTPFTLMDVCFVVLSLARYIGLKVFRCPLPSALVPGMSITRGGLLSSIKTLYIELYLFCCSGESSGCFTQAFFTPEMIRMRPRCCGKYRSAPEKADFEYTKITGQTLV